MSTKYFCNRCGKEIQLPGNDYGASRMLFARTEGREDGWLVTTSIHREYNGKNEDLCADCVRALVSEAVKQRRRA